MKRGKHEHADTRTQLLNVSEASGQYQHKTVSCSYWKWMNEYKGSPVGPYLLMEAPLCPSWWFVGPGLVTWCWGCETDGLSHAHWIHPHKHLLPLSSMTARRVTAAEKRVCGSKFWPRPHRLTWGVILLTAHVLLARALSEIMQTRTSSAVRQRCSASMAGLLPLLLPSWLPYLCSYSHLWGSRRCRGLQSQRRSVRWSMWSVSQRFIPAGLARCTCWGQCICHSVCRPCCRTLWMKSFISPFIHSLWSHFSWGLGPPSIIPMGEGMRKGKYILI